MSKLHLNRRDFLKGTSAVALGAATSTTLTFSPHAKAGIGNKTIIYVFLRGAMDGLSFMPPRSGMDRTHYESARNNTVLDTTLPLNTRFGLHPVCGALHTLFNNQDLALIHACGHPPDTETRSHFDAQEQIELGTPGAQGSQEGWLARFLNTSTLPSAPIFSALAASSNPPVSLGGFGSVATLGSASSFTPNSSSTFGPSHIAMLSQMFSGQGGFDTAAAGALEAVEIVNSLDLDNYPQANLYDNNSIGRNMQFVAQLLTGPPNEQGQPQDLGISAVTVDVGGWDDHNGLFFPFQSRIEDLSDALGAFHADMSSKGLINDTVVVVQTEFGRQVTENDNSGTDHGLGAPMMVLGGGIQGGVYGEFPGIATAERQGDSVRPTTDFRQVLATVCDRVMGNTNIDMIFPGLNYSPIGFA